MKAFVPLFVAILLMLGPTTFSIATSPTVPYHQYILTGRLVRPSGGSTKDFTVVLFAKRFPTQSPAFVRVYGVSGSERVIFITDSTGRFDLSVRDYSFADSIAVGIILPDREPVLGEPISRKNLISTTEYGTFTYDDGKNCNCSSPTTSTIVVGYRYQIPEQTITVPF